MNEHKSVWDGSISIRGADDMIISIMRLKVYAK